MVDQFNQGTVYDIIKPVTLCTPVAESSYGILNPGSENFYGIMNPFVQLMCYKVKPRDKHEKVGK